MAKTLKRKETIGQDIDALVKFLGGDSEYDMDRFKAQFILEQALIKTLGITTPAPRVKIDGELLHHHRAKLNLKSLCDARTDMGIHHDGCECQKAVAV